jgi:hypothetical protein
MAGNSFAEDLVYKIFRLTDTYGSVNGKMGIAD